MRSWRPPGSKLHAFAGCLKHACDRNRMHLPGCCEQHLDGSRAFQRGNAVDGARTSRKGLPSFSGAAAIEPTTGSRGLSYPKSFGILVFEPIEKSRTVADDVSGRKAADN